MALAGMAGGWVGMECEDLVLPLTLTPRDLEGVSNETRDCDTLVTWEALVHAPLILLFALFCAQSLTLPN